jgi:hypothetical protein
VRRKRTQRAKTAISDDALMAYFLDLDTREARIESYFLEDEELLWKKVREAVLRRWIRRKPGTRPSAWWRFDSPRARLGSWPHESPAMRELLRGAGCPSWQSVRGSSDIPSLRCGMPQSWEGYDRSQPPIFESEATFLRRHGLLRAGEVAKLTAADFDALEVLEDPDLTPVVT